MRNIRKILLVLASMLAIAVATPAFAHKKAVAKKAPAPVTQESQMFGSSNIVAEARRYMGTNPTKRKSLWCAAFMNLVLERTGYRGTGSDKASSFASLGTRVSGPQVGAIAVMSRGPTGGHVGIVTGIDASGNPVVISGNHNNTVAEVVYPRGRVYAYVLPS